MPRIAANQIELEYETLGDPVRPTVLLIMGLGSQLTRWPEPFYRALVDAGYHVVRYDNRDVGLSTAFDRAGWPELGPALVRSAVGLPIRTPYKLDDMAADALGLLDALHIPSAHVVGVSMGGMIAQLLAARHPSRVRSLVSMMSTTGSRKLPGANWRVQLALARRPRSRDREVQIRWAVDLLSMIASPGFPPDPQKLRANIVRDLERSDRPFGFRHQLLAIMASGPRTRIVGDIKVPTLILHGAEDPLIPVASAHDLHRRIPGSQLEIYPGMAHDLPEALIPKITRRIIDHARHAARDHAA